LTAEWRYLVMLNYAVNPEPVGPLVPSGTTLDLWDGRALQSPSSRAWYTTSHIERVR
jgi:uncharacterized protein YqjF (DUF2071 family)